MTSMTIAELAMRTKAELIRRGPVAGELAVTNYTSDIEGEDIVVYDKPKTDCKVCLLGASGAARFGDPDLGYLADDDEAANFGFDPDDIIDYHRFVEAVAVVVVERHPEHKEDLINETVVRFFDRTIGEENPTIDASDKLGPVLEVLDEVARRYPDPTITEEAA